MIVNWTDIADAETYTVQKIDGSNVVDVAIVTSPTASYAVSSLTAATSYTYRVRASDSNGVQESNTATESATTSAYTLTHGGWRHVYAVGKTTKWEDDSTHSTAEIYLKWNAMSVDAGSITHYNIYRSTSATGPFGASEKINSSLISINGSDPVTYIDTDASSLDVKKAYYYVVKAIVTGTEVTPVATAPIDHTIIRVIVPDENEAFVNRWIGNAAMCDDIDRGIDDGANDGSSNAVDFGNHYRCKYNGLASTDVSGVDYYDIGHDLMVDKFEMGLNMSRGVCSSHTVGAGTTTDCVGSVNSTTLLSNPEPTAPQFSIGKNRYNGKDFSYIQVGSGTDNNWVRVLDLNSTDILPAPGGSNYGSYVYTNKKGAPPLNFIAQEKFYHICQTQTQSISIDGASTAHSKRLLRRKEALVASQWDESLNTAGIEALESDTSAYGCNSVDTDSNTTNDYDITSEFWPSRTEYMTVIGSDTTANCVSRFGVQDMVGNMNEYNSDQFDCNATIAGCESKPTPTIDSAARATHINGDDTYINVFPWSNTAPNTFVAGVNNQATTNFATYFNPIVGNSLHCYNSACDTGGDDNTLFSTTYETYADKRYFITPTTTYIGTTLFGGFFVTGAWAGRFYHHMAYGIENRTYNIGSRCMYAIDY